MLTKELFNQIVDLLSPEMGDAKNRKALVERALYGNPVLQKILWEGAARQFTIQLVRLLDEYGEIEPGRPVIAAMLEYVKSLVGVDRQAQIDTLQAQLKRPSPKPVSTPQSRPPPQTYAESELCVFISYARPDQAIAEQVDTFLTAAGVRVFRDTRDIRVGDNWDEVIERGLQECGRMVLLLTRSSMPERKEVHREWFYFDQERKPIYPLYIEDCRLHSRFVAYNYIDARTDLPGALERLLGELRRDLDLPHPVVQTGKPAVTESEKPSQPKLDPAAPIPQRRFFRRRFLVPAAALLAGLLTWQKILSTNDNKGVITPSNSTTAPPIGAERSLAYSLTVQKNPKRYPEHQPFATLGDISVEAGDGLRLKLSSPQTGYLYIINEWPPQPNRPLGFTVLFPNPFDNRGSAKISANQAVQLPPDKWLRFEKEKGIEKYWLVWAEQSVPELEAVNPNEAGETHNPRQIEAMKQFLAAHPISEFKAEPDEARQQIKLTGKGTVLVGLVKLDHR